MLTIAQIYQVPYIYTFLFLDNQSYTVLNRLKYAGDVIGPSNPMYFM